MASKAHLAQPKTPFTVHQLEGYIANIYLIEYLHGLLLFDSGAACDADQIESFCRHTLHRSPAAIKLAFISHVHPDHAGGLQRLRKRYDIKVAAHPDIDLWYAGIGGLIQQQIDSLLMCSVARRNKKGLAKVGFERKIRPDYRLQDNDRLPFFNDWTAICVPGHTLHDMVAYNHAARVLYASDCITNVNGRCLAPIPILFRNIMRDSYDKLAALDIDTILLAHGAPLHAPFTQEVFPYVKGLLDEPPSLLRKKVALVSSCSPEVRKKRKPGGNQNGPK